MKVYLTVFIIGILWGRLSFVTLDLWLGCLLIWLVGFWLFAGNWLRSSVVLGLFLLGIFLTHRLVLSLDLIQEQVWSQQPVMVTEEPRIRSNYQELVVVPQNSRGPLHKVLLQTSVFPQFRYGDLLEATGVVGPAPVYEDFSYREYLASRGIGWYGRHLELTKVGEGGNFLYGSLIEIRRQLVILTERSFSEPVSSLVLGTLLGIQRELPERVAESLRLTGLLHIVVVSGYNMMLLLRYFENLWGVLPRRMGLLFSALGLVLYAVVVGFSIPVLRALLMALITLWGRLVGRQREALDLLAFVAIVLLVINPLTLFSVSFQLSFLASLALILVALPLKASFQTASNAINEVIVEPLAGSLGVTLLILPVLLHNFGMVSLSFLPANVVAAFLIPYIMGCGCLALLAQVLMGGVPQFILSILSAPGNLLFFTAEFLSGYKQLVFNAGELSWQWFIMYYLLAWVLLKWRRLI